MPLFRELQCVQLRDDRPHDNLSHDAIGTVVMVYHKNVLHPEQAYEVEFVNADGSTIALLTLKEDELSSF